MTEKSPQPYCFITIEDTEGLTSEEHLFAQVNKNPQLFVFTIQP